MDNDDQILARRQRAQERMRQIQEQNSRLARERMAEEKKEDATQVNKSPFDTDKYCSGATKQTLAGESMSTNSDIVLLVDPLTDKNKVLYYCFTAEELFQSFVSSRRLWKWNQGPVREEPIFKIPIEFGRYIDYKTFKLIVRDRYNTILFTSFEDIPVGSSFGVSQLHGSEERVFTGIPIRQESAFQDHEVDGFTDDDKVKFEMDESKVDIEGNEEDEDVDDEDDEEDDEEEPLQFDYMDNSLILTDVTIDEWMTWIEQNPDLWNTLTELDCEDNNLTSLPVLPASLISLNCSVNKLESLPVLPPNLKKLHCTNNELRSLPDLPNGLTELDCGDNKLKSLRLPSSLKILYCPRNRFTSLPDIPDSVTVLNCEDNRIKLIRKLPAELITFYCIKNKLVSLPRLPVGITTILCQDNSLTSLPRLPDNIESLDCSSNQLRYLPKLPDNLSSLDCKFNRIIKLPKLPNKLKYLNCWSNLLTSLPALPDGLEYLYVTANELTTLPRLPDSLTDLDCSDNPDLVISDEVKRRFNIE